MCFYVEVHGDGMTMHFWKVWDTRRIKQHKWQQEISSFSSSILDGKDNNRFSK